DVSDVGNTPLDAFAPNLRYGLDDPYRADAADEITANCEPPDQNVLYAGDIAILGACAGGSTKLSLAALPPLNAYYPDGTSQATTSDFIDEVDGDYDTVF